MGSTGVSIKYDTASINVAGTIIKASRPLHQNFTKKKTLLQISDGPEYVPDKKLKLFYL